MNRTDTAKQGDRDAVLNRAAWISEYLMAFTTGLLVGTGIDPTRGVLLSLVFAAIALILLVVMIAIVVMIATDIRSNGWSGERRP